MSNADTELEVKFYVSRLEELEARLITLGAQLSEPRVHEINLRFDTHDQTLLNTGRLLRLRQDSRARVTYKGVGSIIGGARMRQELEFTVSDFNTARALFEALEYQMTMMYEKIVRFISFGMWIWFWMRCLTEILLRSKDLTVKASGKWLSNWI